MKAGQRWAEEGFDAEGLLALAAEFCDRAELALDAAARSDWLMLAAYHEKLAYLADGTVRVDH